MCGIVSRPHVASCEACGFHFDDLRDMNSFLVGRLTTGWFMVIGGLLLTVVAVALTMFVFWFGIGLTVPSLALLKKGARVVNAARHGLREQRALPTARVIE